MGVPRITDSLRAFADVDLALPQLACVREVPSGALDEYLLKLRDERDAYRLGLDQFQGSGRCTNVVHHLAHLVGLLSLIDVVRFENINQGRVGALKCARAYGLTVDGWPHEQRRVWEPSSTRVARRRVSRPNSCQTDLSAATRGSKNRSSKRGLSQQAR